jgi:hypothetical protein
VKISNPKALITISSTNLLGTGEGICFTSISSIVDFSNSAKVVRGNSPTQGFPNDAAETTFVNTALPVQLTTFTAFISGGAARLEWQTATEVNNYGFEVERRSVKREQLIVDSWKKIGFVQGNGTTSAPQSYSYTDAGVSSGNYAYRLKQIDNDGAYKYSQETEVTIAVPTEFTLGQNYPNPFNPTTTIQYEIPVGTYGHTSLRVYDLLGREVEVLVNETKEAGSYSVQFNASNFASGVYFYRLQSGLFSAVKKLVLMK